MVPGRVDQVSKEACPEVTSAGNNRRRRKMNSQ
jgi:hypothetical protein